MSWKAELEQLFSDKERVAVLGAGSVLCGDDAAGMLVAAELNEKIPGNCSLLALEGSTAPENFCGVLRDYRPDLILLLDAAYMETAVAEIRFLDPAGIKGINFSTHMLPLSVLVDYLREETSADVAVIGIQPGSTDFDTAPSPEVQEACHQLCDAILSACQ
ncbi:MAG: hydrogenase 3 maturation endopeptidase HyCI [Bacillota bacterium]|nr:hydrogenase 3 maturation endopeptidase HyCI [Bacillota bacterium]